MKWQIEITAPFGGLAPAFWVADYPYLGNKSQAGKMQNIDLTNPSFLTQGAGLVNLTNGNQNGAVTTLLKGILDYIPIAGYTFGIGGAKLYKISENAVINDSAFPHSIAGATDGQDVAYYRGEIYYTYNKSSGGDMGKLTLPSTFDDDWLSTVPTGKFSLQGNVPHPLLAAGNDMLYIGNKNYVSSWDGLTSTATEKDLDLPPDCIIQDLEWSQNRLWIAANRPDVSGKNIGSIYIWDCNSPSWDDEIVIKGKIGGLFVKNGIVFVFYEGDGIYKLGYISGASVVEVASFSGGLPAFYQITEYKNHILWVAGDRIWAFGAAEKNLPAILFQIADGGYSNVGGLACPFGTPIVSSYEGNNYRLAKFSGYETNCYWYSLLFDITGDGRKSMIDKIKFNFEKLASGARVDFAIKNNQGTKLYEGTISYANDGAITSKDFFPKIETENFRIELDWSNGSATNPLSIKSIKIYGHIIY